MRQLEIDQERLAGFCRHHHIRRLALFGSVLRDDFRPDSDVDVLVDFQPGAGGGLFGLARMQDELAELLGREVDLVEMAAVERSRNYLRRKEVLGSAELVYAEG